MNGHFKQLKSEYSSNNPPILHTSSSLITSTNTLVTTAPIVATTLISPSSIKIFNETMNKEIESKNNTIKSDSIDGSNPSYFNDELQATNEQQIVLKKQTIIPVPSNSNSKNSNLYNNNNEDQTTISSKLLNSGSTHNNNHNNNNNNDFNSTRLATRSESTNSNRKEKASSVGYRLGKRKLLFEKRRRISDYALIFAMTGVLLMIIENEFSMANIYSKVSSLQFY